MMVFFPYNSLEQPKPRVTFIEYLRSIFGNDEQINSLGDLRRMLEEQFKSHIEFNKTDVDLLYETINGIKKNKDLANASKKEFEEGNEETKGVTKSQNIPYLDKCKKIGKLGPIMCRMNLKDSFGSWQAKGIL